MQVTKKFPFFLFSFWIVFSFSIYSFAQDQNSLQSWQAKYKEDPENFLNIFNLGVSYQKNNEFKKAIDYYKKSLKKKSKLRPIVLYYLSKSYLSLDRKDLAKKAVAKINTETLPPNFKKKLIAYKNSLVIEEVVKQSEPSSLSGNLKLGYGHNTNPQFVSVDDPADNVESDNQLSVGANLNWLATKGSFYDFGVYYSGQSQSYSSNSLSNFSYQNLNLPLNFYSSKWKFQIAPSYSFQTFSGLAFSSIYSGTLEVMRKISESYLALGANYDSIDTINDDYSYLSGQTLSPYLRWSTRWSQTFLSLTYQFADNNFQDTDSVSPSFESHTLGFSLSQYIGAWAWSLNFAAQTRSYTFDVTENDTRKDSRFWGTIYLGYSFTKYVAWYAEVYGISNSSNFDSNNTDDKNFSQLSVTSGAQLNF